jgi:hypothetical protein
VQAYTCVLVAWDACQSGLPSLRGKEQPSSPSSYPAAHRGREGIDGGWRDDPFSFHITAGKLESWSEALFQTGSGKAHPSRPAVADTDFVLFW